ncbi:VOC family protein [Nocardia seriolae]|uniref:VOC domain-containing protein n=1 Tax=Nocardia seriolae TaxID=37332 RepID=A0ABC8B077_9NOCA|nr:VOC family protein [Nocardia seriolae]APA99975.1 hypothetical protein NS506_05939 [Nocardia seriolae]MTJ64657.1 glyoxalase/bleomycin resistance/dioxygenase family protein [Nocardia seriolae]MTJ73032.1 glyoxalase/bleomycin resistance/dioxygenase family protein [Nocardia seriolae]MTJ89500.1 glyoxalase/bleomycin resistance/dioxygenase family protein [Nocardia seriolae]MTK33475.1 glyoxalase/bleomycin resistance/dioxygenase family protein [Nocardia seriolae]
MTADPRHRIGITAPDVDTAVRFLSALVGPGSVDPATATIRFEPGIEVALHGSNDEPPPRVVDIGTNHLCLRVDDIDAAAAHLDRLPGVEVLGDIITVPDGPIRGNRWIYFRSPWGTLFELQQWPEVPGYFGDTAERLFHGQRPPADGVLPGLLGLDHSGYSVADLDGAIDYLVRAHDGREVLRTEIEAGREFMLAQFGLDVAGTSRMAMVAVGALNLELFQHDVGVQQPPRPLTRHGGNYLALGAEGPISPVDLGLLPRAVVSE